MATKDRVLIELYVDDQGTVKIAAARKATEELTAASTRGSAESRAAAESYAASLARQLGIYALVTAAAYKIGETVVGAFKSGIKAVDDYHVRVIGIAATLTDLAKPGQGSLEDVFRRNKEFAEGMYKSITIESAKHFATANEGMTVYNRLTQSGYATRLEEVGALLTLTDKIKLATQGQNVEMQLNTEILGLMSGQVRAQSLLSMELSQRLGPEWGKLVEKHRQAGDLVSWLAGLYLGITAANREIEGTINAQWATTKSLLELLAIGGLEGAYQDIAGWLRSINDYLRTHEELAGKISKTWDNVSGTIETVAWGIGQGTLALINFGAELDKVAQNPALMAVIGAAAGSRLGPWGAFAGGVAGLGGSVLMSGAAEHRREIASAGVGPYGEGAETFYGPIPAGLPPEIDPRKKTGKESGGGGGADSAQRKIENLLDSLQKEWAQLAQGSLAQVDAWGAHVRREVERVEGFSKEKARAMTLVSQVEALKKEKIETDLYSWAAKESGDHYAALTDKANSWLHKVQGNADAEKTVIQVYFADLRKQREKDQIESLSLQKSQLDALAGALPFLNQQLAVKERILPLEAEITRLTLERKLTELQIPEALKDELRGYQALTDEAKQFNLEMEKNKGLSGWAWGRAKEADQRSTIKDMMGGLESGLQNAFSSGLQGVLSQDKRNLQNIGKTMWQGVLLEANKGGLTRIFDSAAKLLSPQKGGAKGGADLSSAGELLNSAGLQLMTSAGGLALSAIGIMTNSEALVYAGTVLQLAGLAIQIYQMLTAVTQQTAAAALTASAGALTGAAGALMAAAAVPGFHSGGVVAHQGLIVAHNGWPLAADERLILAQTGEGILPRSSMARLGGSRFEALRSGNFEVSGGGGEGGGVQIGSIQISIDARGADKSIDWDHVARNKIIPALKKEKSLWAKGGK